MTPRTADMETHGMPTHTPPDRTPPATGTLTVPLYRLAHGRTGDKGNRSNISVIAWHPALWPVLQAQVTEEAIARQFAHRAPARVARHLLPLLHAMNVVIDDVLDGGVNDALNLDSHGKTLAYLLLDMPVRVPADLAGHLAGPGPQA
ncbi:hypothetical protein SAMN04489710_110127 [Paracidovorax konjaci]|uniref:AtuA-like ferredoxin-fold domain-containing protein n=2 Tax=Paracidovorax konjaci TaxID=32040 RepID=A0A1I1WNS1_9BURK|nr:hypothetical protein SAMN04489710_110127 [Paracidovorax konjaci]